MARVKCVVLFLTVLVMAKPAFSAPTKTRAFEFRYGVVLDKIPAEAFDVKIWIPQISEKPHQIVEEITVVPTEGAQQTSDKTYGNKILYYSVNPKEQDSFRAEIRYRVKRYELMNKPGMRTFDRKDEPEDLSKYLKSNRLVTLSPRVKKIAAQVTEGKENTLEKARAIYDYVFENVVYDKKTPGWGQGDTERVCVLGAGNCTDFHSLFISLARASGIPAKFIIGFPLPDSTQGKIGGYHCWAAFYEEELGWVPVDISEAWKDKTKKDYYFGAIGAGRVEFTSGRDIVLEPAQEGEPLNYFIYPYVEVDGKPFKDFGISFSFKDLSTEDLVQTVKYRSGHNERGEK